MSKNTTTKVPKNQPSESSIIVKNGMIVGFIQGSEKTKQKGGDKDGKK